MYSPETQISAMRPEKFWELVRQHRPWLRRKEAAAYLGVSVRALEVWAKRGIGPAFVKNANTGLVRYHIDVLDAFITGALT